MKFKNKKNSKIDHVEIDKEFVDDIGYNEN